MQEQELLKWNNMNFKYNERKSGISFYSRLQEGRRLNSKKIFAVYMYFMASANDFAPV
jgi:hypothetical protein